MLFDYLIQMIPLNEYEAGLVTGCLWALLTNQICDESLFHLKAAGRRWTAEAVLFHR